MALDVLSAIQVAVEKIKEYIDGKPSVAYNKEQKLTDVQKIQARDNIGAVSFCDIPSWSLEETKPTYTAAEVGALPNDTVIPTLDGYATEDYVDEKVSAIPVVEIDTELLEEGKAADAKAVGDKISAIPVAVAEDGYTDISGLRQVTSINTVCAENFITITTTFEGGEESISEVILDDDGFPVTVVTDGVECTMDWSGFDAMYTDVSEVGA